MHELGTLSFTRPLERFVRPAPTADQCTDTSTKRGTQGHKANISHVLQFQWFHSTEEPDVSNDRWKGQCDRGQSPLARTKEANQTREASQSEQRSNLRAMVLIVGPGESQPEKYKPSSGTHN
jgi:hypothetical protein